MFKFIRNLTAKKDEIGVKSYAQSGEDLILYFIFKSLGIAPITYLDIGAYDPIELSNTYFFYLRGGSGVCIEPNPIMFKKLKKFRKNDIILNIGIGGKSKTKESFYIRQYDALSSFSKKISDDKYISNSKNQKIKSKVMIPMISINAILNRYFNELPPNLVTIDTEGYELKILQAINISKFRPEVFCIETITYSEEKKEKKNQPIIDFMISKGYFLYGDTYINSIFVDKKSWKDR